MENQNKSYSEIIEPVQIYTKELDLRLEKYFLNSNVDIKNPIIPIIKDFLFQKGKRIRSCLIFLLTKALGHEPDEICYNLALAQEFIHNATLIHDDIVDCSVLRRGKKTLNFEYDSKLAVLAGDYLLCEAMQIVNSFDNTEIKKLHADTLKKLIQGELNQYFNRFKILTIENYIEKSKAKTACLFECGLTSLYLHYCKNNDKTQNIKDFALNFGTAFQIKNDADNFKDKDKINEDLKNGDYSAPVIFYTEETGNKNIDADKILKNINKTDAQLKTKALSKQFSNKAIENIAFLEDNLYKQALTDLCRLFG